MNEIQIVKNEAYRVRKVLIVLGVAVMSLPLFFVLWFLLAVRVPGLDALTMRAPQAIRTAVAAQAWYDRAGDAKKRDAALQRVLRIDPHNKEAISSACAFKKDPVEAIPLCFKAVQEHGQAWDYYNLGRAQRDHAEPCPAEESFTKASSLGSSGTSYTYVEAMGRVALWCGEPYNARAGLGAAIDLQNRSLKDTSDMDEEDVQDIRNDQQSDEEYMVVTFDQMHLKDQEKKACSAAHPRWASCNCSLDTKGDAHCSEGR